MTAEPPIAQLADFPDGWRHATVIVAHPDDIEWGVAAAVAAWTTAGRTVSYVLVTSGEAGIDGMDPAVATVVRQGEERASGAIVGVSDIEFLGHPDGRVVEGLDLRRDIAAAIRRHRPDVVVAQHHGERWGSNPGAGWNSADHRAVGRATMDAVSDASNRWIFTDIPEEPWAGVQWVAVPGPSGTHAVDVSAVVDRAVASLAAHADYIRGLGVEDPQAFARDLVEGQTSGVAPSYGGRPAVAFELVPGPAAP
ncbi:MAG: PIG-L deacetylase family protein [Ilumatobacteraceae bacterium]